MNSLPLELHLMIFELLPVQDTVRLRLVSKKWYHLLNSLKHQHLTIVGTQDPEKRYYPAGNTIHTIKCIDDYLLITPIPPLLRSVKQLKTYFYSEIIIDLTRFYNQFRELEDLTCYNYPNICNTIILNLQHLYKLNIDCYRHSPFDLRTPRLTHLMVWDFAICDLYFPDRLQRLETTIFNDEKFNYSLFKNLEFLSATGGDWTFLTNTFLISLSTLKEIHFSTESFPNRETLNSIFTYRREGLRIYLCGFDIDQNIEEDENFPRGDSKSVTKFIVKNYEKTADKVYGYDNLRVEYNELIKAGIKKDFFVKFPSLNAVQLIEKVEDEEALLEFLTNTKPLNFTMENTLLSQTILCRIGSHCEIRALNLMKMDLDIMCPEFDFIYKMESLEWILINQSISLDFLIKAFKVCKRMRSVEFECVARREFASFNMKQVWLYLVVVDDEINEVHEGLWTELFFDSDAAFFQFLSALRKDPQLSPKPNFNKLIFLINEIKHNERLVNREIRRLFKNEVLYVHN